MKLIKPSVEIIKQEEYDLNHIFKFIELAGRTCYKSEDKITEDSAKEFVDRIIKSGHTAMLEHGTVYLSIYSDDCEDLPDDWVYKLFDYSRGTHDDGNTIKNPWIKVDYIRPNFIITTNYRWILENNAEFMLKYLCKPTEFHERRTTVKFICDRAVANEFVRHRVFSFAQESTRYCNYTKDKFNNELTFIIPCWIKDLEEGNYYDICSYNCREINPSKEWFDACINAEFSYTDLIKVGWKPQEARNVLPLSLKTELIMTGFNSDWQKFFELRCAPNAHPQAKELADMLKDKFNK